MIGFDDIKEISESIWEIPASYRDDMRVPARVYISREMLETILGESSLDQLVNVASLPGIERYALAMPDIHQGYGFPIGGIAPIRAEDGVISPGGVGYDINCGVRLLTSPLPVARIRGALDKLATQMQRDVPSGVGRGGEISVDKREMTKLLSEGAAWALKRGYAWHEDIERIEERGAFPGADGTEISDHAKQRAAEQLGTIGSGNHFVEIQEVERIFDHERAAAFGLFEGQAAIMVHTGSRGLGHQTCTDYVRLMNHSRNLHKIFVPDRELSCAPFRSEEGQRYFKAMGAAANFAWVNRQIITHQLRGAWKRVLGVSERDQLRLLYDVAHNIAKLERYDGVEYIVHRKGATRAFGPSSREIPERYREWGQPVIIPGSMGTASYVLAGTEEAMCQTFGSCCHGAGRRMSRSKAKKTIDYHKLSDRLRSQGIVVRAGSAQGLVEEAPEAYKDVDQVIRVVDATKIAKTVARLRPVAVIKG